MNEFTRNEDGRVAVTFGITDTARSKARRFLDERWLRYEINRMVTAYPDCDDQELFRMDQTREIHLVFEMESYAIVLVDKVDHLVVVTQMHDHKDYWSTPWVNHIDETRWRKRYGQRVPSAGCDDSKRSRLQLTPEEQNMVRITSATAVDIDTTKYRT